MRVNVNGQILRFMPVVLATVWLWLACGCSHTENRYSEYQFLPAEGWAYGDTVSFVPVHADSLVSGHLVVAIRHDDSFPYTQAAIELTVGKLRDTLTLQLADTAGRWAGHGIGTDFQVADTLHRRIIHPRGLPVSLRHVMRCDTLKGIDRVGLFLIEPRCQAPKQK